MKHNYFEYLRQLIVICVNHLFGHHETFHSFCRFEGYHVYVDNHLLKMFHSYADYTYEDDKMILVIPSNISREHPDSTISYLLDMLAHGQDGVIILPNRFFKCDYYGKVYALHRAIGYLTYYKTNQTETLDVIEYQLDLHCRDKMQLDSGVWKNLAYTSRFFHLNLSI